MAKKRVVKQTIVQEPVDIFGGLGHWWPEQNNDGQIKLQAVEVKPLTKTQKKKLIERLIDKLDPPRPVIVAQKPKPVKRAPKPKAQPKPKKGKKVGKVNEVCLKSPFTGEPQWMPLVAELSELLAEGWTIVDGDVPITEAYLFLNFNPEELQSA